MVRIAACFQYLMKSYLVSWRMRNMLASDAQRLGSARAVEPDDVEGAHDEDRRDERCDDAGNQGHGEPLHRPRAVLIEHRRGEDGRHVRVDDSGHRVAKTLIDGCAHRFPAVELLANPF